MKVEIISQSTKKRADESSKKTTAQRIEEPSGSNEKILMVAFEQKESRDLRKTEEEQPEREPVLNLEWQKNDV